ncbi:helix-turn-helix domain-containing protein [Aeromonas veronii]|uniref:helix-turn-helix domain-containing protein n=1 Tax=Aeromonas veronii TaxID=654 RepID=UPI003F7A0289
MKTLGERIEEKLNERDWNQADLVRKSGVSKAVISVLLSDPSKGLRADSLYAIAEALRCDPTWLYLGMSSSEWIEQMQLLDAAEAAAKAAAQSEVKRFGQRLDQRLQELGMSMSELARRADLSKSVISNTINNPDREMQVSSLISIAKVLKVDPMWLYSGGDEDKR